MKLKLNLIPMAFLMSLMVFASCTKSDDDSATPDGNNGSGYTPPSTNYYKIDDVSNDPAVMQCYRTQGALVKLLDDHKRPDVLIQIAVAPQKNMRT